MGSAPAAYGLLNPVQGAADFAVDTRFLRPPTGVRSPRCDALENAIAYQWAPRISLEGENRRFSSKLLKHHQHFLGFPGDSDGKESAHNAGDLGSVPGSGRPPGEGDGYPLQHACLVNPLDRGAWWGYSPWDRKESDGLSN